ncbi:DNA polymerase alpha/epsilon subunit B-domain-containing protein [Mycotypha africana]|uniref:DNA polymerase alpha/epsilon subunit B-domain-containing protein n=1 Tax=Mycotypha africana TaxID=64632 RepID=UPI0022FFFC59|nr:DNA polymerase alpha/epsilon subunit B-domain-containing protein [Mycotypha africana]KAI8984018.1 DNA polymerase alpha/epsilon subunit B-domain-containing protein [Mycotypha africana]
MIPTAADQFCSAASNDFDFPIIERKTATYDDLPEFKEQFLIKKHVYTQQYASLYYIRLLKLRHYLLKACQDKWDCIPEKPQYVQKTLDLQPGQLSYMLGTIYIEMPKKPNVINDLEDEDTIINPETPAKYRSDDDIISLEDEHGRVKIHGSCLNREFLITGLVVGILGKEISTGAFEVLDICLPGMAEQDPLPSIDNNEPDKFVALLSGLSIGADDQSDVKTQLLAEFLGGELGSGEDEISSSCITRVILAGNSVMKPKKEKDMKKAPKRYGYDFSTFDATPMLQFDELLEDLCTSIDVDIMAGPTDPAPSHFPQQPMLASLFRNARKLSSFHTVTNPYWCKIDDVSFLGTSGQNLNDIYRYVNSEDRVKMAESCMFWRHIAPSAPDTLWAYPFIDRDPFILEKTPHVYFIGNQPQFEDSLLYGPNGQKVRIVLVPSFEKTGILVLLNLRTLECTAIQIDENGIKSIQSHSHIEEDVDEMDESL